MREVTEREGHISYVYKICILVTLDLQTQKTDITVTDSHVDAQISPHFFVYRLSKMEFNSASTIAECVA